MLIVDGKYVMSDVVMSVGVLIGVVLVCLIGWYIFDLLFVLLVVFNIFWSGWGLFSSSVGGLMDVGVDFYIDV